MYTWIYEPYGMEWYEQGENLTLFSCMNTIQVDTIVTDLLDGRYACKYIDAIRKQQFSNLFIAGSWKRQIGHQREKKMIFLYAKKEN